MPSQTNRPPDKSASPRRRRPLLIVLAMLALLFVITYAGRLAEYRHLLTVEASKQQQFDDAEARGRELVDELEHVKSPEHTEEVAIEEIGLAPPDALVLTLIDPPVEAEQTQDEAVIVAEPATGSETVSAPDPVVPAVPDTTPSDAEAPVWRLWLSVFNTDGE